MKSDQPDETKEPSKKDRKGKKKRDKGSKGKRKGKGKGKGKGKKGSRKKKHQEEDLEDGFLRVSTTAPDHLSQQTSQPTDLPEIKSPPETVLPTEVLDRTLAEMSTREPDSTTVVPSALPESRVTEEVEKFTRRCAAPPQTPSCHLQF